MRSLDVFQVTLLKLYPDADSSYVPRKHSIGPWALGAPQDLVHQEAPKQQTLLYPAYLLRLHDLHGLESHPHMARLVTSEADQRLCVYTYVYTCIHVHTHRFMFLCVYSYMFNMYLHKYNIYTYISTYKYVYISV